MEKKFYVWYHWSSCCSLCVCVLKIWTKTQRREGGGVEFWCTREWKISIWKSHWEVQCFWLEFPTPTCLLKLLLKSFCTLLIVDTSLFVVGVQLLWIFWTWNILNCWMMLFIFLVYDSLLMVIVRPGTSPSDIHAFTLDYHLQSWQDGESFRNRDIFNSQVWSSFIFLKLLHVMCDIIDFLRSSMAQSVLYNEVAGEALNSSFVCVFH